MSLRPFSFLSELHPPCHGRGLSQNHVSKQHIFTPYSAALPLGQVFAFLGTRPQVSQAHLWIWSKIWRPKKTHHTMIKMTFESEKTIGFGMVSQRVPSSFLADLRWRHNQQMLPGGSADRDRGPWPQTGHMRVKTCVAIGVNIQNHGGHRLLIHVGGVHRNYCRESRDE